MVQDRVTGAAVVRPDPYLRGKCELWAKRLAAEDPTLRLVRGWYWDLQWGQQEHWWTEDADGRIIDPTAAQFPHGGVTALYEEYDGRFPCQGCGAEVEETDPDRYERCCSYECFGRMVGVL